MLNAPASQNRQRGFTLIVIFLLVILMVGMAATVLMSSQTDLQIAGQDRESTIAFYAAETGVAYGKDWLSANAHGAPGPSAWNAILNSGAPQLCAPNNNNLYQPGIIAQTPRQPYDINPANVPPQITYNFCIHNNSLDPSWSGGFGSKTDGDGVITIEAFGYGPSGTSAQIIVEVQAIGSIVPPAQGTYISNTLSVSDGSKVNTSTRVGG